MKKYKTALPLETVRNIREILYKIGVALMERHMIHKDLYSCRVVLGQDGLMPLNIGTNGKGRNFEYSLASGYAEFMERLENRLLLNARKMLTDKTFNFFAVSKDTADTSAYLYDPKERNMSFTDLPEQFYQDFIAMCGFGSTDELKQNIKEHAEDIEPLVIPFYDLNNEKVVELPIEFLLLLTGSNGMASGNSPKEAMLQAICEIFERYVISEIYWNELTPPTIPFSAFEGTEIGRTLERYQKETGNTVILKDCSLGKGIPAVGMIIIDEKKSVYNFKLGVDFVPAIALERCFTEIHQGRTSFEGLPFDFIYTKDVTGDDKQRAERNLMKIFVDGTGIWPISILQEEPSYQFEGFNTALGQSNVYDLKYSLDLIKGMGHNIYMRNNSVLGFPAYYIVVPGMSQVLKTNPFLSVFKSSFVDLALINQMGSLTPDMARKIFNAIDENYDSLKSEAFMLERVFVFNINEDLRDLTMEMMATLLSLYLEDDKNAIKYLRLYLKDKDKSQYRYYYACLDYLQFINNKYDARKTLALLYGQEIADEVIDDMKDRKAIFQYYKLPNCPYCEKCQLADECKKEAMDKISRNMIEQSVEIDQMQNKTDIEDDRE